jgi:hypothetical protein
MKDPYASKSVPWSKITLGTRGAAVTPSNDTDVATVAKAVVVTEDGDLAVVPVGNDPADVVEFVGCRLASSRPIAFGA